MGFLSTVNGRIIGGMNKELTKDLIEIDVVEAVHQMNPIKALGLEGIGVTYYYI